VHFFHNARDAEFIPDDVIHALLVTGGKAQHEKKRKKDADKLFHQCTSVVVLSVYYHINRRKTRTGTAQGCP
jgi:hypothetical protein